LVSWQIIPVGASLDLASTGKEIVKSVAKIAMVSGGNDALEVV